MRPIRIFALVGAALVAAVAISSAGAEPRGAATATRVDLSTRAAVNAYLRAIGVNPETVVVQRGRRNYAGPSCPGKRWTCTKARRVVQIATRGAWNQFDCSPSNADPPDESSPETNPPDTCLVVQSSTSSANVAVCREKSDSPDVTQTCTIIQQNTSGANRARVRQVVTQDEEETADATQRATVTQHNASGKNALDITQKADQDVETSSASVAQDVHSDQKFTITQDAVSGGQKAKLRQSTDQEADADHASGGTQHQEAFLTGDVVHQTSGAKSTIDVRQDEDQDEDAPESSGVEQTIVGPFDCCTDQGTNPSDTFKIHQRSNQSTSSSAALLTEDMHIFCSSSGACDGQQDVNENGEKSSNSCSSTGSFCEATLECTGGECTPSSCSGEECDEEEPPEPDILLGDSALAPFDDASPGGEAEAFSTQAVASGVLHKLRVYVDSGSAATVLIAGLYSDWYGHPGTLLATGTLGEPVSGAWNDVPLTTAPSVTTGTHYWIALLGPASGGPLAYRSHCCGGGSPAETSANTELSSLPATWATGKTLHDGSVSAFG